MAKNRRSSVDSKYVQTRIDHYFKTSNVARKMYVSEINGTRKGKRKIPDIIFPKLEKRHIPAQIISDIESSDSEEPFEPKEINGKNKGKHKIPNMVIPKLGKRHIPVQFFSDMESLDNVKPFKSKKNINQTSNDLKSLSLSQISQSCDTELSSQNSTTQETQEKEFLNSEPSNKSPSSSLIKKICKSFKKSSILSPNVPTSERCVNILRNTSASKTFESPSCSGLVKNCRSPEETPKLDKNTRVSKNIKIVENIVISPAKLEQKKINYSTTRVMKEFFQNIRQSDHLKYLLSPTEELILYRFFDSEQNYQYTCIKLFMWKPQFYNIFKYAEKIGLQMERDEVSTMYRVLKEKEFVDTNYLDNELYILLNLLHLKDLRDIQRSFKFSHPCTKKLEIIDKLMKHCTMQGTLTCTKSTEQVLRDRICEKLGFCVKLSEKLSKALDKVYILNTFTNPEFLRIQDYFKELNIQYPTYEVEPLQIFDRDEFLKFAEALVLKRDLKNAIEKKNMENILHICTVAFSNLSENLTVYEENPPVLHEIGHLERFTAQHQYVSILSRGADFVKNFNYNVVKAWMELLIRQKSCSHKRGNWYCLLSLIYTTYLKDYVAAAKLIISAFKDEKEHLSEVQLYELASRGKILDKKSYNLPPLYHDEIAALSPPSCDRRWPASYVESKTVRNNEPGRKRKYVQELKNGDKNYLTVEQVAMEHYRKSGFPHGLHCEGSVICASFCLLFWDIIYETYVKGAFISNMQNAPLDIWGKYFYQNREQPIKTRLDEISVKWDDEKFKEFFLKNWDHHSHEASLFPIESVVNDGEDFYQIIECIGRTVLTKIFERLVKNFTVYRSGFPDLIVWNYGAKKCKFVEVKGENDQLSIKQKLWMKYLMDNGANVELCNVHSTGSKKKKIKENEGNN